MTGRYSWVLALAVLIVSGALMGLIGSDDSSEQSPVPVPTSAESARADAVRAQMPGGDRVPAILVFSRRDGAALTPSDLGAIRQQPVVVSDDGRAAVATVPLGRRPVRLRAQRCGQIAARIGRRRAARRPSGRGHRRPRVRRRHRQLVLRGQHHAAGRHRRRGGAAADRHLPLAGAVAGARCGDRLRRPGRRRRRQRGRRGGRHDTGRVDVRHHQRAGVRGGHQLCAAADLALPRGVGPQGRSPRCAAASPCARPGRRSWPATPPWCWRC